MGQTHVVQVMVRHHRVVAGFLNAKYRHHITSFRRFGKVFIGGKDDLYTAQIVQRGKPMGGGLSVDCARRSIGFSTPLGTVLN